MKSFLVALALGLSCAASALAGTITVGSFNAQAPEPFLTNAIGATSSWHYAQVYSASAFPVGGMDFGSITFYAAADTPSILKGDYQLSFGYQQSMTPDLNNLHTIHGLWQGTLKGPMTGGELTIHALAPPFHYDPTQGNLLLVVSIINQQSGTTGMLQADSSGTLMRRAFQSSNGNVSDSLGLVTTFNTAGALPAPVPPSLLLAGTGAILLLGYALICVRLPQVKASAG